MQMGMGKIHPTAIVNSHAELDTNVEVGPYSVIGPKVKIGKGTKIKSHVVIEGNTTFGVENTIFQFATIGSLPQDLKYQGEDSQLIIGSRNTVREFASLNPGTTGGGMITRGGPCGG
jgi:UDP-N-acetylglucosamine acyltransferase